MSEAKCLEFTKDLDELRSFISQASRQRTKDLLSIEIRKIETELFKEKEKLEKPPAEAIPSQAFAQIRYKTELKSYAWDQSDKFLKIFVNFDKLENETIPHDCVKVQFTDRSINLNVENLLNKDYYLIINNLLEQIDIEKSYWKAKKDMIIIYMKKVKEGTKWTHITSTEKRLKETKKNSAKEELDVGDPSDPSAGLMNVLKKMYDTGDPDMKRMINKAWCEGQEKRTPDNI